MAPGVVALSCLLAACGGSSKAADPGPEDGAASKRVPAVELPADQPQKPACGLVTQAEVEAAIAARVSAAKQEAQPARSLCSFSLVSAPDQRVVLVSTTSTGVPDFFDSARQRAESPQPVSAGDQAFVAGAQALVRKGNTMVAILVVLRQQAAQLTAAATRLAQAVGTHL